MKHLMFAAAIALTLVVTGCAGTSTGAEPKATSSAKPSASKTPKPTPTPTPTVVPVRQIGYKCTAERPGKNSWDSPIIIDVYYNSPQEVWASEEVIARCDWRVVREGDVSTTEREAVKAAGYDNIMDVEHLWGICADKDDFYATNGPINDAQRAESNAALMLCPDHPGAAIMANGSPEQQQREAGTRFADGVREVGKTVQPGTYRTAAGVENCYWARLDSAGNIIDNFFVAAATQVEVTVQPSDFSLHTEGCGEFVKVG